MVAIAHNVVAVDDVAAIDGVATVDGVAVVVGATTTLVVWVQWCWMRPCTSPQSHFFSVDMTLRGNDSS